MSTGSRSPCFSDRAAELVLGDRNADYGPPTEDFARLAKIWSGLLGAKLTRDIEPREVALLMAALKLNRQMHRHKPDNLVDAHGYLLTAEWIETGRKPRPAAPANPLPQ